jgi:hypothetical protein
LKNRRTADGGKNFPDTLLVFNEYKCETGTLRKIKKARLREDTLRKTKKARLREDTLGNGPIGFWKPVGERLTGVGDPLEMPK